MTEEKTHFGFETVAVDQKTERVKQVFDSVASRYDLMNDVLSFGIHRLWKRLAAWLMPLRPGDQVLDLAGGTGDLARLMLERIQPGGLMVVADINDNMLKEGQRRLLDQGIIDGIQWQQADAEQLPFDTNRFAAVTMGFGLRNVTDKDQALQEIHRVLKPGGMALILEFSTPKMPGLKTLYDLYSFQIMPKLGQWFANDGDSYRYLAESIRMHPDQQTLLDMMESAGFAHCSCLNLSGGIVAIHRGYKT